MEKQILLDSLMRVHSDEQKLLIVRKLIAFLNDDDVVWTLCFKSIQTNSHELRVAIIDALRSKEDMVNPYFAHMAVNAKYATLRKWALVNLSLMECKSEKRAVVNGLRDASGMVQHAAALNIGLYHDNEFLTEVKEFFDRNRLRHCNFKYTSHKGKSTQNCRYHGSHHCP